MDRPILLLGNDAMACALVENGCRVAASYPGTPASEILSSVAAWGKARGASLHAEWAVNEKVAFEIAYTAAMTGLRAAVSMKQVGLNVASDALMSAAYGGVEGGFLVISADDPGPHSSQTEQDSRMLAMAAKVPVLDPASPAHARELVAEGFALSEALSVPVMIRPTTRVCHAGQDIVPGPARVPGRRAEFVRDVARWAATPVSRHALHKKLAEKIRRAAAWPATAPLRRNPGTATPRAVVSSGAASAHAWELVEELGLAGRIAFYRVVQPYPLHAGFIERLLAEHEEILVLEETAPVVELQIGRRDRVRGRVDGTVPEAGELLPEIVERLLRDFAGLPRPSIEAPAAAGGRRPTLCPGCPHRSAFYAIRKAAPEGIYPSDIGCYTLGINQGGVDTFLCMGAAVTQAAGLHQAYRLSGKTVDIVATIGDSTFFHAGIPGLIDAAVQGARFVLVILDNGTTAMTGCQVTPASGVGAMGEKTAAADIEAIVRGCGVGFCRTGDPDAIPAFVALLRQALEHARERGPAVVVARKSCPRDRRVSGPPEARPPVRITEACNGCRHCTTRFDCPALLYDEEEMRVRVDRLVCTGCGVCIQVCPMEAIADEAGGTASAGGPGEPAP